MKGIDDLLNTVNKKIKVLEDEKIKRWQSASSNPSICKKITKDILHKQSQLLSVAEKKIHVLITDEHERYKSWLGGVLAKVEKARGHIQTLLDHVLDKMVLAEYADLNPLLFDEIETMETHLKGLYNTREDVESEMARMGTPMNKHLCFDIIGADSKIPTTSVPDINDAISQTFTLEMSRRGNDVDVQSTQMIKQELHDHRGGGRGLRIEERGLGRNNNSNNRRLTIGILISLICNCEEDDIMADIFARRQRSLLRSGDDDTKQINFKLDALYRMERDLWSRYSVDALNTLVEDVAEENNIFPDLQKIVPVGCGGFLK
mmetsp:Transcript_14406/g.21972  ORF Transcript_14406/g.21972 Transcript_14406/m.21972 type:complete len:318 (-) Transcript_14406:54-1007(-)